MLVRTYLKSKTGPTFGRVTSVSQWVVPPLDCMPTISSDGWMLQIRDGLLKSWTVDWFSNSIQKFKLFMPVHHVEGEFSQYRGVGACRIFKLRATYALWCAGVIVSSNKNLIETIFDSQVATFDGFLHHVCCLLFGLGEFVGLMLFKLLVEVALKYAKVLRWAPTLFLFIIFMLEETHEEIRIDCTGSSLPPVCTLPVEHHVLCLRETGGVLVLAHYELFCQFHAKRLVGWISSYENCNCYVIVFCPFFGHWQVQEGCCLERCCYIIIFDLQFFLCGYWIL